MQRAFNYWNWNRPSKEQGAQRRQIDGTVKQNRKWLGVGAPLRETEWLSEWVSVREESRPSATRLQSDNKRQSGRRYCSCAALLLLFLLGICCCVGEVKWSKGKARHREATTTWLARNTCKKKGKTTKSNNRAALNIKVGKMRMHTCSSPI